MKRLALTIALIFSLALMLAPSQVSAQFRFKSRSSRSSMRSTSQGSSLQRSSKKQTTSKSTAQNNRRRVTKNSTSQSKTVKPQAQSSRTSRQSLIRSKTKSQSGQKQNTSRGYQPNGPVSNQRIQTRENWKTGTDILKQQGRKPATSRGNTGRIKNASPFDPKAMEASKGRRMGIFPGERGTGRSIDLGSNGSSSRGRDSRGSSTSKGNLLDRISGGSRVNPGTTETNNSRFGNVGRGNSVSTEEDRQKNKGPATSNQSLLDLINRNDRNRGSNNGTQGRGNSVSTEEDRQSGTGRGTNVITEDERNSGTGRRPGNQDLIDAMIGNSRVPGSNNENSGRGTNVTTEDERNSGTGRRPGNQDLIDAMIGNGRVPGTDNGKEETDDPRETGGRNPREPGHETDIREQFEDLLNGGSGNSKFPPENEDRGEEPAGDATEEPVPTENQDQPADEVEMDDNVNQPPVTDDQDTPVEEGQNEEEQNEVEPEPAEEVPVQEDEYEQNQDNNNLDLIIDLIGNLPVGGNVPSGPIVIEQPIVVAPAPAVLETTPAPQRRIRTDLEVLDIRFVDLGDSKSNDGPCFRVFLKNHNNKFSLDNVQVDLVAGIEIANEDSPRRTISGMVETIAPLGTSSIDIRVTRDVLKMVHPKTGDQVPFSQLAAIADPNSSFLDVKPENNVVVRNVNDIQHVDLKLNELADNELKPNRHLVLNGEGFKFDKGSVVLVLNEKPFQLKVTQWGPTTIEATVPNFVLVSKMDAKLIVVRPDKTFTEPQSVSVSN